MSQPFTSLRVLIADDYPDIAESLGFLLEAQGHHVQVAHDGLEAVLGATVFRPDVILLDIGMPKLDGYGAAREIRRTLGAQVALIALTAWSSAEDQERARQAGFDRHVAKPPDLGELFALLHALHQAKLGGETPTVELPSAQ